MEKFQLPTGFQRVSTPPPKFHSNPHPLGVGSWKRGSSEETPTAPVIKVTPTKTTRLVKVKCPHCHRRRIHGWPYSQPTIGYRGAHCGGPDYLIPTPKEYDHVPRRADRCCR